MTITIFLTKIKSQKKTLYFSVTGGRGGQSVRTRGGDREADPDQLQRRDEKVCSRLPNTKK
jgi:hypothetical protein